MPNYDRKRKSSAEAAGDSDDLTFLRCARLEHFSLVCSAAGDTFLEELLNDFFSIKIFAAFMRSSRKLLL